MSAKNKLRIGIVAFTKEKAEQYAAKWHLPSNAWYHIPVTDKITGLRADGLVFDDVPIAKAQQLLEVTPAQMAHAEAIAKREQT